MCFAIGSLVFCVSGFETSSGGSSRIRFACMVFPIVIGLGKVRYPGDLRLVMRENVWRNIFVRLPMMDANLHR